MHFEQNVSAIYRFKSIMYNKNNLWYFVKCHETLDSVSALMGGEPGHSPGAQSLEDDDTEMLTRVGKWSKAGTA